MNALGMLIYFACALWVALRLQRDYLSGLCWAVGLMVFLPTDLRIPMPGFELTIQRLLELLVIGFWLAGAGGGAPRERTPFLPGLWLLAGVNLVSTFGSINFAGSIKSLIAMLLEVVLFYAIVAHGCADRSAGARLLRAAACGLGAVAAVATVEKYAGLNLSTLVAPAFGLDGDGATGTYPHRIMLGYGMAMGMPLLAFQITEAASKRARRMFWLLLLLVVGACYFSNSRGPWLGMAIACALVLALGTSKLRRQMTRIAVLAGLVLLLRPGVWSTISSLTQSTFQEDSVKGDSYRYRWRLWYVAVSELGAEPFRLLTGYGPLSTEKMDLSRYFGAQQGGTAVKLGYTSWDNNYACDLIELGFLGFLCEATLFVVLAIRLAQAWIHAAPRERGLPAAVLISAVVFLFALSNVYMFAPQLRYLFWLVAAVGLACPAAEPVAAPDWPRESEEEEHLPRPGMALT